MPCVLCKQKFLCRVLLLLGSLNSNETLEFGRTNKIQYQEIESAKISYYSVPKHAMSSTSTFLRNPRLSNSKQIKDTKNPKPNTTTPQTKPNQNKPHTKMPPKPNQPKTTTESQNYQAWKRFQGSSSFNSP